MQLLHSNQIAVALMKHINLSTDCHKPFVLATALHQVMRSSASGSLNRDPPIRKRKRSEVEDLTPHSNGKVRNCNVLESPSSYEMTRTMSSKEETRLPWEKKAEKARRALTSKLD